MPEDYIIDVEGLSKSFKGKPAVRDFSIKLKKGRIFGFLGANGSGKTTTIRLLCGLLTPDKGKGTCIGYDLIKEAHLIKNHVGYMTQKFSLYEDLTIRENLDFMAQIYQMHDRSTAIDEALKQLSLAHRQDQLAGQLSGGWKQRLALAACILHKPKLLLLDEPTAGVDPKARRDFWDQIHRLTDEGMTVLVSTHYMDEAERCDEIAYMSFGELLIHGTIDEVLKTSKVITWIVDGPNLTKLSKQLEGQPGIDQTIVFGTTLHITGLDEKLLNKTLEAYKTDSHYHWKKALPNLEDIFIHVMGEVKDPYNNGPSLHNHQ